jgi:hypothetical protein
MVPFDTVVLFDVENLLGEPSGWQRAAAKLSFGDILSRVSRDESGTVGRFAVSRAYANWGRSFMSTLRQEMTENGVEPRQIFGFDRTGTKNAADIELVIDAMDLAYLRPDITTFVLVTRDGGFSALARKLHELGKAVVVCADADCSRALRSVADVFIDLPDPEAGLAAIVEEPQASQHDRSSTAAGDRVLDETREKVLDEIGAIAKRDGDRLDREGIQLQVLGVQFARTLPSLGEVKSGYAGLKEFLQWALVGSPYCVIRKLEGPEGSKVRLGRRSQAPQGFEQLPNLERRRPRQFRDQATLYRFLASQGEPYIRLADPQSVAVVLGEAAKAGIDGEELSTVIDRIAAALAGQVAAEDVKFTLLALSYGDAMSGEPAGAPVELRKYALKAGTTPRRLRASLLATVREKLETRLSPIDDAVLGSLVAEAG